MVKLGKFQVGHQNGVITLARTGEGVRLPYSYAEGDKIKQLLGIAGSLEQMPVLMPHVESGTFRIVFNEDDTLNLKRLDGRGGDVPFTWREIDKLIDVIEEGIKMFKNDQDVGLNKIRHYVPQEREEAFKD